MDKFIPQALTVLAGLYFFYHQQEIKVTKERFLDKGLDSLLSGYDNNLAIFRNNFSRCINALTVYKREGNLISSEWYNIDSYEKIKSGSFDLIATYRIDELLGDDMLCDLIKILPPDISKFNDAMIYGLSINIRGIINAQSNVMSSSYMEPDKLEKKLNELSLWVLSMNHQVDKYYELNGKIYKLSQIFSEQNYHNKAVPKFKERGDVKKILKDLSKFYAKELKETKNYNPEKQA